MAEKEDDALRMERGDDADGKKDAGQGKENFKEKWDKLATWQKAGVLIGGGVLVIMVILYLRNQSQANAPITSSLPFTSPNGAQEGVPGSGDQFPPVPTPTNPTPTQQPPPPVPIIPPSPDGNSVWTGQPAFPGGSTTPIPAATGLSDQQKLQDVTQKFQSGQIKIGPLGTVFSPGGTNAFTLQPSQLTPFLGRPAARPAPRPISRAVRRPAHRPVPTTLQGRVNELFHR